MSMHLVLAAGSFRVQVERFLCDATGLSGAERVLSPPFLSKRGGCTSTTSVLETRTVCCPPLLAADAPPPSVLCATDPRRALRNPASYTPPAGVTAHDRLSAAAPAWDAPRHGGVSPATIPRVGFRNVSHRGDPVWGSLDFGSRRPTRGGWPAANHGGD